MGLLGDLFSIAVDAASEFGDIVKDTLLSPYSDYSDHSDYSDAAVRRQKEREVKKIALAEEQKALQNTMNRMLRGEMSSFIQDTPYANITSDNLSSAELKRMNKAVFDKIKTQEADEIGRSTESIQKEISDLDKAINELEGIRNAFNEK